MAELNHVFVTELDTTDRLLSTDYFLISQRLPETASSPGDGTYISRKIDYQTLSGIVLGDIDDKVQQSVSSTLSVISTIVSVNIDSISAVSSLLDESVSAIIKMANCIQANKYAISAISGCITSADVIGENGISAEKTGTLKWRIGHTNEISARGVPALLKIKYDGFGHITGCENVTSADILSVGNVISGATNGITVNAYKQVSLLTATSSVIGGVKINGNNLAILPDGVLSATDNVYTNGEGISLNKNKFSLMSATANTLGGVKINGNNLAILPDGVLSATDTTYGIATSDTAGLIMLGYEENDKNYALKEDGNGHGYVTVPWTDLPDLPAGTVQVTAGYTISSITFGGGGITEVGQSNYLSGVISELCSQIVTGNTLSNYLNDKNGSLYYDRTTGDLKLTISPTGSKTVLTVDTTTVPCVTSGEVTDTRYYPDPEGEELTETGTFIKLAKNSDRTRSDNIYINVSALAGGGHYTAGDDIVIGENNTINLRALGRPGDIVYASPDGTVKQTVCDNQVLICETDEEIERSIKHELPFKDIFNNWQQTGYQLVNNVKQWYGYTPYTTKDRVVGLKGWVYNNDISSIQQKLNTQDTSMFISKQNYSNYDITVRCYSQYGDDDYIGLVAAFKEDAADHMPKVLMATRTTQFNDTWIQSGHDPVSAEYVNSRFHWYLHTAPYCGIFDRNNEQATDDNFRYGKFINGDQFSALTSTAWGEPPGGWAGANGGCLIRLKREGDMLSAWTTPFLSSNNSADEIKRLPLAAVLTADLGKLYGGLFSEVSGGAKIGYYENSQISSSYENIKTDLEQYVVDTRTNAMSAYDPIAGVWEEKSVGRPTLEACGIGRVLKNSVTGKSYYTKDNTFDRLVTTYTAKTTMLDDRSMSSVYDELIEINSKLGDQLNELNRIV